MREADRSQFNSKRKIEPISDLRSLAERVGYGGNPDHKRNPGDFGLSPASRPGVDASKCDESGIFTKADALHYLRLGVRRGLISEQWRGNFPQNIWAVTDSGIALEAQLENEEQGIYHGYPLLENDAFREKVLQRWSLP